jgi:TPP-dependent 2-oxoacid decarboxylase
VGVSTVFHVPGDFALGLLREIEAHGRQVSGTGLFHLRLRVATLR